MNGPPLRGGPLSRAILTALVALLVLSAPAWAQSFERLMREGREARDAGDLDTAIKRLEEAVSIEPENADALLMLGSLYGIGNRYEEGLQVLRQARAIAPGYLDVRLAIGRILSWQRNYAAAQAEIDSVLAERPENFDAHALTARIAFYQGELDAARAGFEQLLQRRPNDLDALLGLGDVYWAQERWPAAQEQYKKASDAHPGNREVAKRLERRPPATLRWRLDTGFAYSDFSRESRSAWHEGYFQLSYALDRSTKIHARSEISDRFEMVDSYFEGGVNHRFADWASGYISFGGTPDADFRERWTILTGGALRLAQGARSLGPSLAIFDFKQARYDSGHVQTIKPGLQQYLLDGHAWITAQAITVIDENNTVQPGWSARIGFMPTDGLTVHGGYIRVAETQANETVDTDSVVAGLVVDVTERIALRVDYTRDDRESSYIRHAVNVGATLRF